MAEKAARLNLKETLVHREEVSSKSPQLKTAGTQKVFPLSPLRTPLTPSQKNKVCNPSLGGTGGTLFTQHYSCPAVLRCYIGSTRAAFRELFLYGKSFASIAQPRRLRSIGKAATSVLPPFFALSFFSFSYCACR